MKPFVRALCIFSLLAVLAGTSGCGLIDAYFLPPPEDTAQELFEAGMDAMRAKEYTDAQEYFTKLRDRYPFSPYTLKAEISLGDAFYLDGDYLEAAEAYKEFEAMHPSNEEVPYAIQQIGMANFHQFETIDRRQENIHEALEYFYRLIEEYPDSKYVPTAQEYIKKSRRILAEHEVFIADFFWRSERYGPAWHRYQYVVENFSDVKDLSQYAKQRAQYSYLEYQKSLSEEERARIEDSWLLWVKKWL